MRATEVHMTVELNERQLNQAKQSLRKVKKRLHDAELTISVEPPKSERMEYDQWREKVHELIETRHQIEFPTFAQIKDEWDQRRRNELEEKTRMSLLNRRHIPAKSLEKLAQTRELKTFGQTRHFGPKPHGEIIGEVKNYSGNVLFVNFKTAQPPLSYSFPNYTGVNSFYSETRPIIRIDHKSLFGKSATALPPWIGPMYYSNSDPESIRARPDYVYQIGFKSPAREVCPAEELKAKKIAQRDRSQLWREEEGGTNLNPNCTATFLDIDNINPFSYMSAKSTIIATSPQSRGTTPKRVVLGPRSISPPRRSRSTSRRQISHGDDDTETTLESSAPHKVETPYFGGVNVRSRVLQEKLAKQKSKKFKIRDYTMGGLTMQVPHKGYPPEEFYIEGEEVDDDISSQASSVKSFGGKGSGGENATTEINPPPGTPGHRLTLIERQNLLATSPHEMMKIRSIGEAMHDFGELHSRHVERNVPAGTLSPLPTTPIKSLSPLPTTPIKSLSPLPTTPIKSTRRGRPLVNATPPPMSPSPLMANKIDVPGCEDQEIEQLSLSPAPFSEPLSPSPFLTEGGNEAALAARDSETSNKAPDSPLTILIPATPVPRTPGGNTASKPSTPMLSTPKSGKRGVYTKPSPEKIEEWGPTSSIAIIATMPLNDDVKPELRRWASEKDIYSPSKPQTIKFLKEYRTMSAVELNSLLLREKDEYKPKNVSVERGIEEMMRDIGISDDYFSISRPASPKSTNPSIAGLSDGTDCDADS